MYPQNSSCTRPLPSLNSRTFSRKKAVTRRKKVPKHIPKIEKFLVHERVMPIPNKTPSPKCSYFFRVFIVKRTTPFLSYKIISDGNVPSACLLQPPLLRVDRMIRRTSLGACNSRTQPMSRRFHRPVYFKASFPAKEIIGFGLPERTSVMKKNGCFS